MFGKKTTAEELIKLFSALSDEEKQKFLGAVNGGENADPAPEGEPAEADAEKGEEQPAPAVEETAGEGTGAEDNNPAPTEDGAPEGDAPTEEAAAETPPAEDAPPAPDTQAQDNTAEILEGFGNRLTAIEEVIKELTELKEQMQKYTQAQADKFGYGGTVPGNKKGYKEMSAAEMKSKILNGEI